MLVVQRGEWEGVIKSNTLWLCFQYICFTKFPRKVRPSDVIEAVKAIAIKQGIENDATGLLRCLWRWCKGHSL